MRYLLAILFAHVFTVAAAQTSPPLRVYAGNNSVADPLSYKLRMTGSGVSCSPVNGFEWCTITGGTGTVSSIVIGTGISSTQSPLTTTGTLSVNQGFTPTWSGVHTFGASRTWGTDNTYNDGDVTHRAASLFSIGHNSGATGMTFNTTVTDGAGIKGFKFNANPVVQTGNLFSWENNGAVVLSLNDDGTSALINTARTYLVLETTAGASANVAITGNDTATLNAFGTVVQAQTNIANITSPMINLSGAVKAKRTGFSNAAYVVTTGDWYVAQTGTMSASRVVTLPLASTGAGRIIYIVDESGTVTAGNTLVVTRAGADTINGATTSTILTAYGYRELISDGTSKWTLLGSL